MNTVTTPHELQSIQNEILSRTHVTAENVPFNQSREYAEFQAWKAGTTQSSWSQKSGSKRSRISHLENTVEYMVGLLTGRIQDDNFLAQVRNCR